MRRNCVTHDEVRELRIEAFDELKEIGDAQVVGTLL
jgi:hypothetical protein